ncbi:hypothetical protein GF385_02485 [Candidatus Dependentiae bacterium]|nr:hypothetical protein [Candidatus Dependentiae bacterium]
MKKFLFLIILFFIRVYSVTVDLKVNTEYQVKDDKGKVVPAVYQDESFNVEVHINDSKDVSDVELKNNNLLNIQSVSRRSFIQGINNKFMHKLIYEYTVETDQLGLFEIGPALVKDNGRIFESNKVLVKVLKRKESTLKKKNYELFCRLTTDKLNVFEGEPIEVSFKIFTRGKVLQFGIKPTSFPGFEFKEEAKELKGQEELDGVLYSVFEKKFILIPTEPGLKKINPIQVQYDVPEKNKRRFSNFGFNINPFLGDNTKRKRAFSNDLNINVQPLSIKKEVDGIGDFSEFKIKVDKKNAILNEPILLKLEVSGIGNLEQIVPPKLNLPDFFNYYKSKSKIEREKRVSLMAGKKIFEYVLQIPRTGEHEIEPQVFSFFDSNSRRYKKLKSNSIIINIEEPPKQKINDLDITNVNDESSLVNSDKKNYKKDINFIEEYVTFFNKQTKSEIPIFWFLILIFFPFLVILKPFFKKVFLLGGFFKKNLSVKLKKDLDKIIYEKKADELYKFFVNYFALRFNLNQINFNENLIEEKLLQLGWSKQKIDDFFSYLQLCASLSFSSSKDFLDHKQLLDKSKYWFFMLESKSN